MPTFRKMVVTSEASVTTSPWVPANYYPESPAHRVGVSFSSGATVSYHVEYHIDASALRTGSTPNYVFQVRNMNNKSTATSINFEGPVCAFRVVVSAFASGTFAGAPALTFWVLGSGL